MNNGFVLARADQFGNIYRTPCGIVSVNVRGVTLHLTEDAFGIFSSMVGEAKTALLDRSLREMMKENEG